MFKIKILSIFSLLILASSLSTCTKKGETTTTTTNNPTSSDITTTTTTEKQKQNIEGITFQDQSVAYDGEEHSIYITGDLPTGVTVTYENNGKIEIGEYKVVASFTDSTGLYNVPENMEATLTIYDDTVYYDLVFNFDDDKQEYKLEAGTLFTEVPEIPDKLGYEAKWDYDFANPIIDNTEVNILYTAINYGITYHLDGGTNNENNQDTYTILDDILLEEPTKKGYTFTGWYSDSSLETEVTSISNETGNKELYAGWELANYKVSYYIGELYLEDGLATYTKDYEIKSRDYGPKPEYKIVSWTDGENIYNDGDLLTYTFTEDFSLYAYEIYYYDDKANDYVEGEKFNYSFIDTTLCTASIVGLDYRYEETDSNLIIPSHIVVEEKVYTIIQLSTAAFAGKGDKYNYVYIPHTIKQIGMLSFHGWKNITKITIPDNVEKIGVLAFENCANLKEIYISKYITSIVGNPFKGCSGLEKMIVDPENPVYDSRDNCNAIILTSENKLVSGCKNTIIPESVTTISSRSFCDIKGITSLYIHKYITTIEDNAFLGLKDLEYINVDAENPYYTSLDSNGIFVLQSDNINYTLLLGCKNTILGSNVTEIGSSAFYENLLLTNIILNEGLLKISNSAFYGCANLESIEFPTSLTTIEYEAFKNCTSLGEVVIPSNITSINYGVFSECKSLTKATINYSSIEIEMFSDCINLATIVFGTNVSSIKNNAFKNCTSLKSIVIPSSVTIIKKDAFLGCTNLTIYCEEADALSGWEESWNSSSCPVYYQGQWEYVEGVPTVKENE